MSSNCKREVKDEPTSKFSSQDANLRTCYPYDMHIYNLKNETKPSPANVTSSCTIVLSSDEIYISSLLNDNVNKF